MSQNHQYITEEERLENIARVAHESYRGYVATMLPDQTEKPWDELSAAERRGAVEAVLFNLNNLRAPASASHASWLAARAAAGWTYGPVKDAEAKTHPNMVDYEDLPEVQQRKYYLFKSTVAAMNWRRPPDPTA